MCRPRRSSRCQICRETSSSRFHLPFQTSTASTSRKPNSHADPGSGTAGCAATTMPPSLRTCAAHLAKTSSRGPYRQSTHPRGGNPTASQCPCRVVTSSPAMTKSPSVRHAAHARLAEVVLCSVETTKSSPAVRAVESSSLGRYRPSECTVCRCRSPRYHPTPRSGTTGGVDATQTGFGGGAPRSSVMRARQPIPSGLSTTGPNAKAHRPGSIGPGRYPGVAWVADSVKPARAPPDQPRNPSALPRS